MAATRTDRRVLPDKAGPFTTRELTEFIRLHEIDIVALQRASNSLDSGERTTLVGACLAAGMKMPQISAILDLRVDAETKDSVFLGRFLTVLGQTKEIAAGAAEEASAARRKAERVDHSLRATKVVSQVKTGSLPGLIPVSIGILVGAIAGLYAGAFQGFGAGWGWFVFVVLAIAVTFIVNGMFFSTVTVESELDVPAEPEQKVSDDRKLDETDVVRLEDLLDKPVSAPADTPKEEGAS